MKPRNEPYERRWYDEREIRPGFNWPMAIYLAASVIANVALWWAVLGGI